MSSRTFFNTAPQLKSDDVLRLAKAGRMAGLLQAVENERNGHRGEGKSKDGKITVKRVGSSHQSIDPK